MGNCSSNHFSHEINRESNFTDHKPKYHGKVIKVVRNFSWAIKNSLLIKGVFMGKEFYMPLKFHEIDNRKI